MSPKAPRSRILPAALIAAALLLAGVAQAQVSGGVDRNTSKLAGDQSECAIAKNPTNKLQLFTLCNNNAGAGLFAARSIDGGLSWVYPDPSKTIANGAVAALGPAACCDPTLAWDTFGNLFITYIDSARTSVITLLSQDGGQTFASQASFGPASIDQPTVVADAGEVWIVWNQAGAMVARGAAVTGLGAVGAFGALQAIPGTAGCSFGDIAIAPNGAVAQVCESPDGNTGPASLLVNTKADGLGPNPFGAATTASATSVGGLHPIPAQSVRTIDAEASLAYDRNPSSPHFGRLYLVYTDGPTAADTNILLRFSDTDGASWSASPVRVDDDASGRSQFFPKIAGNRLSGNIAVCWYDTRNSAANTAMQTFCTVATPTGASPSFMANAQIGDGASVAVSNFTNEFGDYSGLAYFQGVAHPVWPDTSNSTGDNPNGVTNFDIYTDRVTGGAAANEGDPHITTVNGVLYDFQAAGEFNVLRDSDGSLIQTRQTPISTTFAPGADPHDGLATCVCLNTAVAARVGAHKISYEPNVSGTPDPSGLQLRIDGALTTLGPDGLDLGAGGRLTKTSAPGGIEIDFPNGTVLLVTPGWWASQGKWFLNVDVPRTPSLEGVMGAIGPGAWLPTLPDGSSMGPMPATARQRYADLYGKFADAWRVTEKTSLFDYRRGTSTASFTDKAWPGEKPPCLATGSPPATPAPAGVAARLCRPVVGKRAHADCLFDVAVTGDAVFAKTYVAAERIAAGSTTTTVSADGRRGEATTLVAVVTRTALAGKGVPTGTVQFTVGRERIGKPVALDARGEARLRPAGESRDEGKVMARYTPAAGSPYLASLGTLSERAARRDRD